MILCAGKNEIFDFAKPVGVGLVESAITLTKYVLEAKPSFLLFVGTAGSYGNYKIFDTAITHHAANIELGYLKNECYTPLNSLASAKKGYVSRGTNTDFPIVNSSNYITTSLSLSKKMLEQNIELENMEFFSIVNVANHFNIPCSGFFVVTNYCNENAHADFLKNHAKAKELITSYIKNFENTEVL